MTATADDRLQRKPMTSEQTDGHLRFVARHRVRVVRLLSSTACWRVLRRNTSSPTCRPTSASLFALLALRRGLRGPSVRRADLRPHRRPDRPQVHLPRHHRRDGRRHLLRRRAARLCDHRGIGADRADRRCGWCRASRSAANTAARRPTSPSTRRRTSAAIYTRWIQTTATLGLFMALLLILGIRTAMDAKAFGDWGWRIPFLLSAILLAVSIWIRLKLNEIAAVPEDEGRGQGLEGAADGELLPVVEQQDRAAGAARRHRRPRRGVVRRTVLRAVLPHQTLKVDYVDAPRS